MKFRALLIATPITGLLAAAGVARADQFSAGHRTASSFLGGPTFLFTQNAPTSQKAANGDKDAGKAPKKDAEKSAKAEEGSDKNKQTTSESKSTEHHEGSHRYREISDFFNIREAYSSVEAGEWEFETSFSWETNSDGSDDDVGPAVSLKYGITDTFFVELEVEQINLGDGGDQGNGELALILFKQWWSEAEILPAFATWGELRIPSGEGSSGVDAEFHFNLTKELIPNLRGHFEGFVETANGARGGDDEDERRSFQWGVGPGFDYSFSDDTIVALNYLMRSSEEEGHHNLNILQLGLAQRIADNQHIKLAFDIGLDGAEETPNFGAKVLWSIEF